MRNLRAIAGAVFGSLCLAGPATAATITVTSLLDSGAGTLRNAVATAAPGDTIDFSVSGTILLTSGRIVVDKDLAIVGPGAASLTIDGNNADRIFHTATSNVAVSGLTFANGKAPSGSSGGGILTTAFEIDLVVSDCVFTNCQSAGGGAIESAAGILTVTGSTFTGNQANGGGAIRAGGHTLTILDSSFAGNSGSGGSAVYHFDNAPGPNLTTSLIARSSFTGNIETGPWGAVRFGHGAATVTDCTFSNNNGPVGAVSSLGWLLVADSTFTGQDGGGVAGFGWTTIERSTFAGNDGVAIVVVSNGNLSASNVTITGNLGGVQSGGSTTLNNCTIADNVGWRGLYATGGEIRVKNSIVAANPPSNCEVSGNGKIVSRGHNLDSGTSCGFSKTGDLSGATAQLDALADNGGATQTRALLAGSPAIDAGDPGSPGSGDTACAATDQRGASRLPGPCDIGAYEEPSCGNGVTSGAEQCDDGNLDPADGCTDRCTTCGDAEVTEPEQCDDGNDTSGDGCSASCTLELPAFQCYQVKAYEGEAPFVRVEDVDVVDAFFTRTVDVKKPWAICAPANLNAQDSNAPLAADHLEAYTLVNEQVDAMDGIEVTNRFGTQSLDIRSSGTLMVPTAASFLGSPDAPTASIDHFSCYKVRRTPGSEVAFPQVSIVDRFGGLAVQVLKPTTLCAPADKNGEAPGADLHSGFLTCYATKPVNKSPRFTPHEIVYLNNQFGPEANEAFKMRALCVPTWRTAQRFIDNGNGTIFDVNTGLTWEKKTGTFSGTGVNCATSTCTDPHDVNNRYQWCAGTFPTCDNASNPPDGGAFTDFVAALNSGTGFAGFTDWRLPTLAELQTLIDEDASGCGSGGPCIDPVFEPIATEPGPTYWSTTSVPPDGTAASCLNFENSGTGCTKSNVVFVRAVR
jgi:cysteine-rich repeat protein